MECYQVYIHQHTAWRLIFQKPIVDWSLEDHELEIVKRRGKSTLKESKLRWEKFTSSKIGIGKEFDRVLTMEPEIDGDEEGDRFDRAIESFEKLWENAPHSNIGKLWSAIEDARKLAGGIEKSKAGRKRKIDGEVVKTRTRGRPSKKAKEAMIVDCDS
jgi:hypothetical protein